MFIAEPFNPAPPHARASGRIAYAVILCAFACYAALFIYKSSIVVHGVRYFALFDDGMISMRYAHNLAQGYGLVWNPGGARVEGYTNLLWTLGMAALHRLPLALTHISVWMQIAGAVLLLVNLVYVRRIAFMLTDTPFAANAAVFLTATYNSLNFWAFMGMEVSLATLLITCAVFYAMRDCIAVRVTVRPYLLLGLGTLLRPDMFLPLIVLLAWNLRRDRAHWRLHVLYGLGCMALFGIGQTVFRLTYYGEFLPNTYYLKMTGYPVTLRMVRGVWEMAKFVAESLGLPIAVLIAAVRHRPKPIIYLIVSLIAVQFAYNIYTGGDAWEAWGHASRFVCIIMPLFMVLMALTVSDITDRLKQNQRARSVTRYALVCLPWILLNGLYFPAVLRETVSVFLPTVATSAAPDPSSSYYLVSSALLVDEISTPRATMAVMAAGTAPYFANRTTIDLLGKCDPVIAREPTHRNQSQDRTRYTDYVPGHMKWDYAYSVGRLKPDIINDRFDWPEAKAIMRGQYATLRSGFVVLHLRRNSSTLNWNKVKLLARQTGASLSNE